MFLVPTKSLCSLFLLNFPCFNCPFDFSICFGFNEIEHIIINKQWNESSIVSLSLALPNKIEAHQSFRGLMRN